MFHGSPERWELLKDIISDSLHPFSSTRWSARIQSVRPFAANLPGLKTALESLLEFHLTAQAMADVKGFIKYISSFKCVLMSSIWFKALKVIDDRSKVLQARSATIDIEVKNIDGLIRDLQNLKGKWPTILAECKAVAKALKIELWSVNSDKRKKRRKRFFDKSDISDSDESEDKDKGNLDEGPYDEFRLHVFEVIVDSLLTEMKNRYGVIRALEAKFAFLLKYLSMEEKMIQQQATLFSEEYIADVSVDLVNEILHLKAIHTDNLGKDVLPPLDLLNRLAAENLEGLFPNVCVALRIFCTGRIGAECSFSGLTILKNDLRSTMGQLRLSSLGMLYFNSTFARHLNFDAVMDDFANRKARKANLQ